MSLRRTSTVLLLGLWAAAALAGEPEAGGEAKAGSEADEGRAAETSPYGLRQLRSDLRYLVHRPAHLDLQDKVNITLTAGAWGGLFLLREDIRDHALAHRSPGRTRFLQDVRVMSRGSVAPGIALAAYLVSFATDSDREKETALMVLESAAVSALISGFGNLIVASDRPEDGDEIRFFEADGHSVSLDASLAAAVVEPLRCQYLQVRPSDGTWKRIGKRTGSVLLYAGAALTSYQRVDQDKHWAPDAFLGTLSGLAVGRTLCEAHGKRPSRRFTVAPQPVAGGAGLAFRVALGDR